MSTPNDTSQNNAPPRRSRRWVGFIPLAIIIVFALLYYFSDYSSYVSYASFRNHRQEVVAFVQQHFLLSSIIYIAVYLLATALSIPGAIFLSIVGGFLFPQPFSTLYVMIGATLGASCLFLAARTALQAALRRKVGSFLQRMESGFNRNTVSYMFFLRLVPLFPFWLVNIAPAFFRVPFVTYVWTTFLGILPGAFVFTQIGTGLGAILDSGETFSVNSLVNPQVKIALVALGLFALLPIFIKWLIKRFSTHK
jgi:uncharacterized membrane protein YdjX (TVP38/TMEM64 family)